MLFSASEADIQEVGRLLKTGAVVAVPTETVYGLAADALNPEACQAIFAIKGRPLEDPLICHILDVSAAENLAVFSEAAYRLAAAFWPGPLTLVLPKKPLVPDLITAGLPCVALRCPAHPVMRKVLQAAGCPLAAPSANPFGYVSPTTAQHVADCFGSAVPILDAGPCGWGVESTILDLSNPRDPCILRPGPISAEALSGVLGCPVRRLERVTQGPAVAPGLLERHYSPRTPITLLPCGALARGEGPAKMLGAAYVFFQKPPHTEEGLVSIKSVLGAEKGCKDSSVKGEALAQVGALPGAPFSSPFMPGQAEFWLTQEGCLEEAAQGLYALLRYLDQQGFSQLYIEQVPETGLGVAINERLRRASSRVKA